MAYPKKIAQPTTQAAPKSIKTGNVIAATGTLAPTLTTKNESKDFSNALIAGLNKQFGEMVAYNLGSTGTEAPTVVRQWIPTGSKQLDAIIRNAMGGGLPGGRVIEVQGPPSIGKSHLAFECCKSVQKMGGIVIYIDTENATSLDNLRSIGINPGKQFVFIQENCIEQIFSIIESVINRAREIDDKIPVLIVWDSVAQSSPKAELEGDFDQQTIGLAARILSKGMRKIVDLIGDKLVTMLLVNQQRMKIGVMYGDPTTTPGGNAVPYAASVRLKMTGGSLIKKKINGEERVVGIEVNVEVIKNKIAPPRRKVSFNIIFGKGIEEDHQIFDAVRVWCENQPERCFVDAEGNKISLEGTAGWKYFRVTRKGEETPFIDCKFYKDKFGDEVVRGPHKAFFERLFEAAYKHSTEGDIASAEEEPEDYETAKARTLENTSIADLSELD